jgi:hypothetical protein
MLEHDFTALDLCRVLRPGGAGNDHDYARKSE